MIGICSQSVKKLSLLKTSCLETNFNSKELFPSNYFTFVDESKNNLSLGTDQTVQITTWKILTKHPLLLILELKDLKKKLKKNPRLP